jgi:hypothetical protein
MSEPRRYVKRLTASASAENGEQILRSVRVAEPEANAYLSTPAGEDLWQAVLVCVPWPRGS